MESVTFQIRSSEKIPVRFNHSNYVAKTDFQKIEQLYVNIS